MVLQHSSVGKSLLWHISYNLLNAKMRTFPLSYAVIPSFISCFTTFCSIDPYFIFEFAKILVCLIFVVLNITCDCSIRISYMTVVLE